MTMTAQEIFTKVATHLLTQKVQARKIESDGSAGNCRYRTDEGLTCAVGCLIPEDLYFLAVEGLRIVSVIDRAEAGGLTPELSAFVIAELAPHVVMLSELQSIHDSWDPATEWFDRLTDEAKRLGLVMPTLS